jgi:hypothetical protein
VRRLRGLAGLCLLLALAGCWTGDAFYTAAESRPALPAGDYATTSVTPEETGRVRVSIRRDSMTLITPIGADGAPDPGDSIVLGFAPLGGDRFAAWLTDVDGRNLAGDTVPYGLLRRGEGGEFRLIVPACTGNEAGAAVIRDAETIICHFATRAALEAALRALGEGGHVIRLTPLPRP